MRCCKNKYLDTSEAAGVGRNFFLERIVLTRQNVTKIYRQKCWPTKKNYTFKFGKKTSLLGLFPWCLCFKSYWKDSWWANNDFL